MACTIEEFFSRKAVIFCFADLDALRFSFKRNDEVPKFYYEVIQPE